MKNYFVLLLDITPLKNPLEGLKKCLEEKKIDLVLAASSRGMKKLSEQHRRLFSKIFSFEADHFNCQSIGKHIRENMPSLPQGFLTTNEACMILTGQLNDLFNLKQGISLETASLFTDKIKMKAQLKESGIRLPRHCVFEPERYLQEGQNYLGTLEKTLGFPIIAKPIDAAGAADVSFLNHKDDLKKWADHHALLKAGKTAQTVFELDEFITGQLYHCDSIIDNGKIIYSQACEYLCTIMDFLKGHAIGSIVMNDNNPFKKRIREFSERVLRHLPLEKGVTHLEFFHTPNDEFVFLEIAARPPGSHIPQVYFENDGINIEEIYLALQMNLPYTLCIDHKKYAAWLHFPLLPGKIKTLCFPDQHSIKSHITLTHTIKSGQVCEKIENITTLAAMLLLTHENYEQLYKDWKSLEFFKPYELA